MPRICCSNGKKRSFIFLIFFSGLYVGQSFVYGPQEEGDINPSHTILKLNKRDDELARRLAREHGMVIRVV